MNIEDRLLSINDMSRPGEKIRNIKKIVIHYIGKPNISAIASRNYFESLKYQSNVYISSHYIIGINGEIVRCIPEEEVAWHCGNMKMNYESIGIENCHSDISGKFNNKTIESLAHLMADICKRYNLNPKTDILRHYDIVGKRCPRYYVDNPEAFEQIKQTVQDIMDEMNSEENITQSVEYRVVSKNGLNIRRDPSIKSEKLGIYKYNEIIKISQIKDGWGVTDKGWVSMQYLEKL